VHNLQQLTRLLQEIPTAIPALSADHFHLYAKWLRHWAIIGHTALYQAEARTNAALMLKSLQYMGHHGNVTHMAAAAAEGDPNPQLSPKERAQATKQMLRNVAFMMMVLSSKRLLGVPAECDGGPLLLSVNLAFENLPFWMRDLAVAPYDSDSDIQLWTKPPLTGVLQDYEPNPRVDESQVVGGQGRMVDDDLCPTEALSANALPTADALHEMLADQELLVLEQSSASLLGETDASSSPDPHHFNASGMLSRWVGRGISGLPFPHYCIVWRQEKEGIRRTASTASIPSAFAASTASTSTPHSQPPLPADDDVVVWVSGRYGFYLDKASRKWRRSQCTVVLLLGKPEADALFLQLSNGLCKMDNPFCHLDSAHYGFTRHLGHLMCPTYSLKGLYTPMGLRPKRRTTTTCGRCGDSTLHGRGSLHSPSRGQFWSWWATAKRLRRIMHACKACSYCPPKP